MTIGVYAIEHIASGRFYVGNSVDMEARWSVHRSKLRRGKHHCIHLQRAWDKYGSEQFEFLVLSTTASQQEAVDFEQRLLDRFFDTGALFNSLRVNTPLQALNEARAIAHSKESQRKRVATTRANGNFCAGQRKPVRAYVNDVLTTFCSVAEAARQLGLRPGNVWQVCVGNRHTTGGISFWYAGPE